MINGLKREELIAANSVILHEIYFDGLGDGAPSGGPAAAITRDFGSVERWRTGFSAMGKAEGGGSGWVILSYSPRDKRLVNQWAADHTTTRRAGVPFSCSTCASTPITWIRGQGRSRRKTLTQQPSWRYSSSWRAPRSGYPENVHSFRRRSPLRWLLQERPAVCMGRL
jgi:hypothetical protein